MDVRILPRRLATAISTVGLALLLAGTTVAQEEPSPSPVASPSASALPLEARPEGPWDVLGFDAWGEGLVEPLPATTLTAVFLPDGRLEGETGCGTYFGGYLGDGESIAMWVTSKGPDPCSGKRLEEAVAYSVAVEAVAAWRPTDSGLELLDDTGSVRLLLGSVAELALAGDWVVERLARPNGKLVEPPSGTPLMIRFEAEGRVGGSTGCRLFEGLYEYESDRVVVAPIDTVGLPCEGAQRRAERWLLADFDGAVLWARTADELTLSDGFGAPLLVLRPAPPDEVDTDDPAASAEAVEA